MTTPTLTCEHCESEIDVEKDPRCIQQGGMDVMCEACRERAFDRWMERSTEDWPPDLTQQLRAAYRIKRGWQA